MPLLLFLLLAVQGSDCAEWRECRERALEAAAREEYDRFHDLAWRAVQKGPPRDPDLMYLLARAQSLSGRPADALVMIRRLSEMGIATDAATSDAFERVRSLPGWTEVSSLVAAAGGSPSASATAVSSPAASPSSPPSGSTAAESESDAIRFEAVSFVAAGLAYDAVSRRFVVGDRDGRKLFVVDERSRRANDLVGAISAGFHSIAGLDIDPRRGDLWVVTVEDGQPGAAALHKLQLVSGRLLATLELPAALLPARFTDVAVTPDGSVLALDAAGGRIVRAHFGSRALDVAATLEVSEPTSLAPARDGSVYVSHRAGLVRVDLDSGKSSTVSPQKSSVDVAGLERIRWRNGSLVAVQRGDGSICRVVRLALNGNGRRVLSSETLEASAPASAATAATLSGDAFYYVAIGTAGDKVVRRLPLR
jgi:hypothetical protein